MNKVYITVRKERKYNPNGEITYDGMMEVLGVFEDKTSAEQEAKDGYDEFCKFQYQNYVVMGDREDLDGLFVFDPEKMSVRSYEEYELDGSITSTKWEVLEWEVQK